MVTVATDHREYTEAIIAVFQENPSFRPLYREPYFVTAFEGYGGSFFDSLWRSKGYTVHYMRFQNGS
jgi:tRNA (guanine-N7-)-methyltransferase